MAYAESLFKTLKSEWLDRHELESYAGVWNLVDIFFKKYTSKRLHVSIGYQSPDVFERQCLALQDSNYLTKGDKTLDMLTQDVLGLN